jgi:hypothetical protein
VRAGLGQPGLWTRKAGLRLRLRSCAAPSHFKGVFRDLKIQDQTFKAVPFDFPEGNDKD